MKFKFLLTFLIGGVAVASAQGYQDGVHYYRADQPEEAEIILTRTLDEPSTDKAIAYYYLGQIDLQNGDKAAAKTFFDKGIQANPENGYNYIGLGALALAQGDSDAAKDFFKRAKDLGKKDCVMLTDIARAYYNADPVKYAKELDKAIADAKKANKECPALYILQGDMVAPNNAGEGAAFYEMAMRADAQTKFPEAYVKYARTYFRVNPRFAIERLEELLGKGTLAALAQRELAEKYYDNNQLTKAAEVYGQYIQNPNHFKRDEQRYVGLLYFGKKYPESYQLAGKLLSEDPDNFYMKRMRFLNKAAMEDAEGAIAEAAPFFAAKGEFVANDYTTMGEMYNKLGQDSLAALEYEKAVAVAPDNFNLLPELSTAYTQAGQYSKAAEAQQKFVDSGEASTNDILVLARRYQNAAASEPDSIARNQFVAKGIEAAKTVNERVPGNVTVLMTEVRLMMIGNDKKPTPESVDIMKEVINILDQDPENVTKRKNDYIFVLNQLGQYYLAEKDADQAKVYLNRFLEIDPDNQPLRDFVDKLK